MGWDRDFERLIERTVGRVSRKNWERIATVAFLGGYLVWLFFFHPAGGPR